VSETFTIEEAGVVPAGRPGTGDGLPLPEVAELVGLAAGLAGLVGTARAGRRPRRGRPVTSAGERVEVRRALGRLAVAAEAAEVVAGDEEQVRPAGVGHQRGRSPARVTATSRPTASRDGSAPAAARAWRH
jgi:hypothetical protein